MTMEQARRLAALERRFEAITRARVADRVGFGQAIIELSARIAQLSDEVAVLRAILGLQHPTEEVDDDESESASSAPREQGGLSEIVEGRREGTERVSDRHA